MATTSPDTLWSPDPTGNYNLVADLATMQTSNQTALIKRANMYVGTSTQRTAFTTAPEGVHWQDTNGDKREYVRKSGSWVLAYPKRIRGTATVPALSAGQASYSNQVNFPAGSFSTTPDISVTWEAVRVNLSVSSRTNSGFQFAAANWTSTNQATTTTLHWVATEQA